MNAYWMLLGIVLIVAGCGENNTIKQLDVRTVTKDSVLRWSQLTEDSRFVRLETKEGALLNDYFQVWAGDKYIITYGNDEMHQFAADGKHIRKLASSGRASGEYQNVMSLTVDESKERLYFTDYGSQGILRVMNLENGEYETPIQLPWGTPKEMVLAEDTVLYCLPLRLKETEYEVYKLSVLGHFLGGIKRTDQQREHLKHLPYLGLSEETVHYMFGMTDTLYQVIEGQRNPKYSFRVGHQLTEFKEGEKGEKIEIVTETPKYLLLNHIFMKVTDRYGSGVTIYDENRDPEVCAYDKVNGTLFKVKAVYFDELNLEMEDYFFQTSGRYLCQIFNATEFREMIQDVDSPRHHWYNEITDDDNPILLLGKVCD